MAHLDHCVAVCLVPLALWILVSGLDDLFITLVFLLMRRKPFPWPSDAGLNSAAERRIAIFVPLWHEHRVVGKMLESNLKRLRYANYEVFAGVYPNDELTVQAVAEAAMRHPRVHMITCEHDGPTTKGDCLNRIYAAIADYEKKH